MGHGRDNEAPRWRYNNLPLILGGMIRFILAILTMLVSAPVVCAQTPGPAGRFDYYLLTLSWSPAFCASHRGAPSAEEECAKRRGFVVHGLWPQNEDGTWPAFCRTVSTVPVAVARRESAIMPNVELIAHEWAKHGSCTVNTAQSYFDAIDREFAALHLPPRLLRPETRVNLALTEAKQEWIALNPGLGADMISFQCGHGGARRSEVQEVRLCLDQSLGFRTCGAGQTDTCPATIDFVPLGAPAE